MTSGPVEVVLFDIGGVLVRLGGVAEMQRLAGMTSAEEVWHRWLACPWVRSFERGWCTADEFAAGVVATWQLPINEPTFLDRFRAWPEVLFDGAAQLVASAGASRRVGCLSNTNAVHWTDQVARFELDAMFDVVFLSHQLGLVKPDRELFDHVTAAIGVAPDRILFLDDNVINVTGARAAGWTAVAVTGVDAARDALIEHGCI